MQPISALCKPRESIFVDSDRDDVLDLSNLIDNHIDVDKFFEETFETSGMKVLFETAFKRFEGKSPTGVIKLTQAMGGGKTHCMLALALLAENPKWRKKLLGNHFEDIGAIKVVAFTGRETDAAFGIWGSIAEQLGKKELFSAYYSPLQAPGQAAWINLLKDQNILILFDELPPYLENARSIQVGNSDLSQVTCTALANLFSAIGKEQLSNVCLVFSDLKATYETGSALLQSSFRELENEANRCAIDIEPVGLNSDEIYDILKKRLFESCPSKTSMEVNEIAKSYKQSVDTAQKLNLTNYLGDHVFLGIKESYPFHPSIKDLYARFKENPNFQQTRGMIRLMRQIIRRFYESGLADQKSLINVFDIDLNDKNTLAHIKQIKSSLDVAINYDLAQDGRAIAEIIDAQDTKNPYPYAQNFCKLLLMSSLNDLAHGLKGLTENEAVGYLCEPDIDINQYKKAFDAVRMQSWYLKEDNRGHFYFQNQKNLVAEMNTLVQSYNNDFARKELQKFLQGNFNPVRKCCYEQIYILPALDEIKLDQNKITLVICEPYHGNQLNPEVQQFYENEAFRNRVMFLSGSRSLMDTLIDNCKKLAAIKQIVAGMDAEHVSPTDQQYKSAAVQMDKVTQALLETIRQTFVTLYFPTKDNRLRSEDFLLEFKENSFKGEDQIISVLERAQKFSDLQTEDIFIDLLRKKCEQRLFTTKQMRWSQILERAATETIWGWYHPNQMNILKAECLKKELWRESGGYLDKGPFEKEPTDVTVTQTAYDFENNRFTIKVFPHYGTKVYWEIGADPTTASNVVENGQVITSEPLIRFLCIDENNEHPTGDVREFLCKAPLKFEQRTGSQGQVLEFKTHPKYEIRYTTDGSNVKENGGIYNGTIAVPESCHYVNVIVYYQEHVIDQRSIEIVKHGEKEKVRIQNEKPLTYRAAKRNQCTDTQSVYKTLEAMKRLQIALSGVAASITQVDNADHYVEINIESVSCSAANIQAIIDIVRGTTFAAKEVNVALQYKEMVFSSGADFCDWVDENHLDLITLRDNGDIMQ